MTKTITRKLTRIFLVLTLYFGGNRISVTVRIRNERNFRNNLSLASCVHMLMLINSVSLVAGQSKAAYFMQEACILCGSWLWMQCSGQGKRYAL